MGKDKSNGTVIELKLPAQVVDYIDQMVDLGLWGDTREEVCLTLIREGLRRHWKLIREK